MVNVIMHILFNVHSERKREYHSERNVNWWPKANEFWKLFSHSFSILRLIYCLTFPLLWFSLDNIANVTTVFFVSAMSLLI